MKRFEFDLMVLGSLCNPEHELEMFAGNEFGFNVTITYKRVLYNGCFGIEDGTVRYDENETETFHNITEFHWLFDKNSMACESNFHGTGFGRERNHEYKKVEVVYADRLYEDF
jgi:hypothetical protein